MGLDKCHTASVSSRVMVLMLDNFARQGNIWKYLETLLVVTSGGGPTDIEWVEMLLNMPQSTGQPLTTKMSRSQMSVVLRLSTSMMTNCPSFPRTEGFLGAWDFLC